jgi:NADPH:quinone reductase-like Zn-dependent oxidoreductase
MKATVLFKHGGPEVLEYTEIPDPRPGPGEVLVRVKAVALNHLDIWVRGGLPHLKISFPHLLGSDIAGVVEAPGPGVADLAPGAKVLLQPARSCGHCQACLSGRDNFCRQYAILGENTTGGYGELIAVARSSILPYPDPMSFEEAACIPLTFQTAWQMVVKRAKVGPGDVVLLGGAGSGVTIAAVQIVKLFGGLAVVSSTSDEKLEKIRRLGADHVINSRSGSISAEVKKITGGRGADVVVDHVGGVLWAENAKSLAWGGRLVTCGATSGPEVKVDLRQVFFKQLSILGSTMGSRADLWEAMKHVAAGRLRPVLDSTYALKDAQEAHRRLENGLQFGKIVLVP